VLYTKSSNRAATSLLCLLLAACGGGGGSSPSPVASAGIVAAANAAEETVSAAAQPAAQAAPSGTAQQPALTPVPAPVAVIPASTPQPSVPVAQADTGQTPAPQQPAPVSPGAPAQQPDPVLPAAPPQQPAQMAGGGTPQQPQQVATADATKARFDRPLGIARDGSNNLYIADSANYTIRKITPSGNVTTLAGKAGASGSADGSGAQARFSDPKGIAVNTAGVVYVVDGHAIRRVTPAGAVTTLAGKPGEAGDIDGPGSAARFNQPWQITADAAGNLFVADTENRLVRKVTAAGAVSTVAGIRGMRGKDDGGRAVATFLGPRGIAVDGDGVLYVSDWYGPPAPNIPESSTFIRKVTAAGEVSTLAGNYRGETADALFRDAFAIAADSAGNVYVAAQQSVRKVSPAGNVSEVASSGTQFDALQGITIDAAGVMHVTDTFSISKVTQDGSITLVAGHPMEPGSTDVP
jgi:hypothetical protein